MITHIESALKTIWPDVKVTKRQGTIVLNNIPKEFEEDARLFVESLIDPKYNIQTKKD